MVNLFPAGMRRLGDLGILPHVRVRIIDTIQSLSSSESK